MAFKKATKEQSKLRLALFGTSGSGKTFTALRIATGMGGKIAVIDTERGSAAKYADRFEFDVCEQIDKSIGATIQTIKEASNAGYNVLIIDSLSHSWQELLEEINKIANAKYKGNTWAAWSEGTPKQKALVEAILSYSGHVIATMRSKTEWSVEKTNSGSSRPVRTGLAPEAGKGIEYEFDMLMEISTDHVANIIKDRTGRYQDEIIEKPGEPLGKDIMEWLNNGVKAKTIDDKKALIQKYLGHESNRAILDSLTGAVAKIETALGSTDEHKIDVILKTIESKPNIEIIDYSLRSK